jgi:bifunctional ADP-heptose synthase (sugar kinase/adenylyltransferase)
MAKDTAIHLLTGAAGASLLTRKLCHPDQLAMQVAALPRPLVFTNGVFDVLHRGHVMYLEQARALGASLMVALNTDASVHILPALR